jgi:hypothetical protein
MNDLRINREMAIVPIFGDAVRINLSILVEFLKQKCSNLLRWSFRQIQAA